MRLKTLTLASVLTLALVGIGDAAAPTAALALSSCPSSYNYDWVSENWSNSNTYNVQGLRAPIETRLDGTVCTSSTRPAEDSAWVALEPSNSSAIAQIGFIHEVENGVSTFCRFWATDGGGAHSYGCGSQSNYVYVYFKVSAFVFNRTKYFGLYDCGTSGYGSCTAESSQTAWSTSYGIVAAESSYGGTACTLQIMGSGSYPQNLGTSAWQDSIGGTWSIHALNHATPHCTDYKHGFSNTILSAWDSRNSS